MNMTDDELAELNQVIAQEKRAVALEMHHEAWKDCKVEGIDLDILADAAMSTAMEEIVSNAGEEAALQLVDALRERIIAGEFVLDRTLQ